MACAAARSAVESSGADAHQLGATSNHAVDTPPAAFVESVSAALRLVTRRRGCASVCDEDVEQGVVPCKTKARRRPRGAGDPTLVCADARRRSWSCAATASLCMCVARVLVTPAPGYERTSSVIQPKSGRRGTQRASRLVRFQHHVPSSSSAVPDKSSQSGSDGVVTAPLNGASADGKSKPSSTPGGLQIANGRRSSHAARMRQKRSKLAPAAATNGLPRTPAQSRGSIVYGKDTRKAPTTVAGKMRFAQSRPAAELLAEVEEASNQHCTVAQWVVVCEAFASADHAMTAPGVTLRFFRTLMAGANISVRHRRATQGLLIADARGASAPLWKQLEACISQFSAVGLISLLHAFASIGVLPKEHIWAAWYKRLVCLDQNAGTALDAKGVSTCIWSLAKLSHAKVPREIRKLLLSRLSNTCGELTTKGVCISMWGLARLHWPVVPQLVHVTERSLHEQPASFSAQGLSNLIWSFAQLGSNAVSESLLDAWCAAFDHASDRFSDQALSNIAWASAKLQETKPTQRAVMDTSRLHLWEKRFMAIDADRISAQANANSMHAFCLAGWPMSHLLFQRFQQVWRLQIEALGPSEYVSMLWSTSKSETAAAAVDAELIRDMCRLFPLHVARMNGRHLSTLIWAFARLASHEAFKRAQGQPNQKRQGKGELSLRDHGGSESESDDEGENVPVPERELWFACWLKAAENASTSMDGRSIGLTLYALARFELNPGDLSEALWNQLLDGVKHRARDMDSKCLCISGWALGKLVSRGFKVEQSVWRAWLACAANRHDLLPVELTMAFWGIAKGYPQGAPAWMLSLVEQGLCREDGECDSADVNRLGRRELSAVIYAYGIMRVAPSNVVLAAWAGRVLRLDREHVTPWLLSSGLWAFARIKQRPNRAFLKVLLDCTADERWMANASAQSLSCLAWACASLRYIAPPAQIVKVWAARLVQEAAALKPCETIDVIWTLGRYRLTEESPLWALLCEKLCSFASSDYSLEALPIANAFWAIGCRVKRDSIPDHQFLVFEQLAQRAMPTMGASDLFVILQAFYRMRGMHISPYFMISWKLAAQECPDEVSPQRRNAIDRILGTIEAMGGPN
ncbi:hypothetical protein FVE85_8081 [Porphyridium purpureum]|uniref:Tbc2 translation factor, chloroplastic n=1 Tax=Porphyridium purpureum TaxID=35688 RepID=A0A5J4YPF6_PORPP|nr:hypothetical protein FVE85_8081 [Porphyridium purpureum]|eukprot:POR6250..scf295_9